MIYYVVTEGVIGEGDHMDMGFHVECAVGNSFLCVPAGFPDFVALLPALLDARRDLATYGVIQMHLALLLAREGGKMTWRMSTTGPRGRTAADRPHCP
jgi:hypothetical protein